VRSPDATKDTVEIPPGLHFAVMTGVPLKNG
jgi:hypothetical protein